MGYTIKSFNDMPRPPSKHTCLKSPHILSGYISLCHKELCIPILLRKPMDTPKHWRHNY